MTNNSEWKSINLTPKELLAATYRQASDCILSTTLTISKDADRFFGAETRELITQEAAHNMAQAIVAKHLPAKCSANGYTTTYGLSLLVMTPEEFKDILYFLADDLSRYFRNHKDS